MLAPINDNCPSGCCHCQCNDLNCRNLYAGTHSIEGQRGGHIHYVHLPCPNNSKVETQKVEEMVQRAGAWSDRDKDLVALLPTEGLCLTCYLAGRTEQPRHDLIFLCPHPLAVFQPFSWKDGRLVGGPRYMADKSTFVDLLKAITQQYAGVNPEATHRWIRLHGAAQDLLEACGMAIDLLLGTTGDDAQVLIKLREAMAKALGEDA